MADVALFEQDGDWFVPSESTRSPWSPESLHGGAVAALLARAVERVEPEGQFVARLTLELVRPVPVEPLRLETRVDRPGKRVQAVAARLTTSDGTEVTRATSLRIRHGDFELPESAAHQDSVPGPGEPADGTLSGDIGWTAFHNSGVEMRWVEGSFATPGAATVWIRLQLPVVAGEEPSGAQRACAAADFGNGVSSVVPYGEWIFINPDLSVHLARPPAGEWICLEAVTRAHAVGAGIAESALYDERGRIGRSVQSLLIDPV